MMAAPMMEHLMRNILIIPVVIIAGLLCWKLVAKPRQRYPLPPGPPGEFLLGHYRAVPFEAAFRQYAKWGKEYNSDVLYFETFGTKWIVLNCLKAAKELLDKRGSIYSDRPRFVLWECMGWGVTLTWLRWSPKMLQHRKVLQSPFTKSKVGQFQPSQRKEALRAVRAMMEHPENWNHAIRRFAVAVVLSISYGIDIQSDEDVWIKLADDAAQAISNSGAPASSIIDRFPMTRFLPDWLPFMERLKYAHTWKFAIENITNIPFKVTLQDAKNKIPKVCFAQEQLAVHQANLDKGIPNEFDMDDIKGAAAAIYVAGNDTTATTVILFVLYLMENPEAQRKAQAEIDRVVGSDRLPTWNDIPNLAYLNAVLQECYRMNPLSPLGIPHASIADDVYEGKFIPKGTIVYQNVWAMTHDEAVYSDPFTFRPERFLPRDKGGNEEPPPTGNFGFGRRVCIGRNLAENSMLIIFATILATLDIDWPAGPDGKPTPCEVEWSFKGQAHPLPFACSLTPRSEKAEQLLKSAV